MKHSQLRTILLGIVASGVCYAANPTIIPTAPNVGPVGLAATTTQVLYSDPFCQTTTGTRNISRFSSNTVFATLPDQIANAANFFRTCAENYFAISPGLGGFPAGTVYASAVINQTPSIPSTGTNVILSYPGGNTFATLPPGFAPVNHAYVSFDTVGTFGFSLIVTGQGSVIGYNAAGAVVFSAANPFPGTYALEGTTVAPLSFLGCPGCLFVVAAGLNGAAGAILTSAPGSGVLTVFSTNVPTEPESIQFVPTTPCSFGGFSYFVSGFNTPPGTNALSATGAILAYTAADLAPFAGQFLVPDEDSGVIWAYSGPNQRTVFSATNYQLEGAQIVQCPVNRGGCPATQGFWKHHTLPSSMFVSGTITIGTGTYTAGQLVDILNTPAGGNAALILGHQLIAALANFYAGAQTSTTVAQEIAAAEALYAGINLTTFVDPSSPLGIQMTTLANLLDSYNSAVGLNCSEGSGLIP